ncbi:MAG: relaxase/mobilization nuclease domain-containing protein [Oscillospiraceae bacterium]|nr:relaxase/mobilization nuclease domain-containing protein [Oscillospiraceae bacterium]
MAVLRHFSIKNSPLATLKYITGETKAQKAAIVTGINCSDDPESAYIEMKMCYEHYAGEKFHRGGKSTGKEHIKMHHYVISFKGQEVTPQEADRIAQEWAKSVFGDNFQILIATHTDTNNIHVHLAVNAFGMNGKRWLDNKSTVKLCREKINAICKKKKLNVIENPKYNTRQNYAEWLANRSGTSWKHKLCDDIDKIVLMEDIHNIPRGIIGDEVRIRQVIVNLMTNAIKYTEKGSVTLTVSQSKQDYGINLLVSVADTGIGITEENIEKLFTSFRQVDTKKNRSVEGTGLGLAISKRLITQMGGFIGVKSEYGAGSV